MVITTDMPIYFMVKRVIVSENLIGYLDDRGNIIDTQSAGENCTATPIEFDNSEKSLEIIRHSTAHLMAQAIKELYPDAQFFVGPVVDEGFYYDFRVNEKIGEEDLKTIEKKMKELIKKKYKIEKYEISKEEVAILIKARKILNNKGLPKDVDVKTICEKAGISRKTGYKWADNLDESPENEMYKEKFESLNDAHEKIKKDHEDLRFENEGRKLACKIHGFDALLKKKTLHNR